MLKGHRRFVAVSLAWCVAVWLVLRAWVPLVPTRTIEFREAFAAVGFTQTGELAVCSPRSGPYSFDEPNSCGPIEFWSLAEGKKVGQAFSSEDLLVSHWIPPSGEVVIKRDGKFILAKARTGEVVATLPNDTGCQWPIEISKGTRLVYSDGNRVRLFDLVARREAWAADGVFRWYWGIGPGFVVATQVTNPTGADRRPGQPDVVVLLDLESGQLDHRFDHLGELTEVLVSESSPYAIVSTITKRAVCDVMTGKELWTIASSAELINFRFEDDGAIVRCDAKDSAGHEFIVRWRAVDGKELTWASKTGGDIEHRYHVPKTRYSVDSAVVEASSLTKSINDRLSKWNVPSEYRFDEKEKVLRVMDLKRGASLGVIPSTGYPILKRDGSGCAIAEDRFVHYFAFPPSRNWAWLWRWALIPPGVVWVLREIYRRIRDRRILARQAARASESLTESIQPVIKRSRVARVLAGRGQLVVAILWCVAVYFFWRERVPLSPTWSATFDEPVVAAGVTEAGELMVYRKRAGEVPNGEWEHRGPVEFWNLREGRKTRETFTGDDHPVAAWGHRSARMVVERGGAFYAASGSTGEIFGRISALRPGAGDWITPDGASLIWSDGDKIGRFDFESRRELWVAEGYRLFWGGGPGFIVAIPKGPPPGANVVFGGGPGFDTGFDYRICLNLETGQPDARFEHLGELSEVIAIKDSRYVVVYTKDKPMTEGPKVCDGRTGAALWSLPSMHHFSFRTENRDTELCIDVADESGKLHVVRWRAEDGTVITPMPERGWGTAQRFPVPGTRFAVDWVDRRTRLPRWLTRLATNWKVTRELFVPRTTKTLVTDVERNESLGFISHEQVLVQFEPSGAGFVIGRDNRIEYYSLPPSRNWGWLLGWGLIPPGVVWGLSRFRNRWRVGGASNVSSATGADSPGADASGSR